MIAQLSCDTYAYTNGLKDVHPAVKILFAFLTLGLVLASPGMGFSLLVLGVMTAAAVGPARIPVGAYGALLAVPLVFLSLGSLALFLGVGKNGDAFLHSVTLGGYTFGVVQGQMQRVGELVLRSLGAVACLNFLILTTPFVDLLTGFRRLRLPVILLDLIFLVYRYIFVTLETASRIHLAQEVRLGFRGIRPIRRSLALLAGSLWIKTFLRSRQIHNALESRAYGGELAVLAPLRPLDKRHLALVFAIELVLGLAAWYGWR